MLERSWTFFYDIIQKIYTRSSVL